MNSESPPPGNREPHQSLAKAFKAATMKQDFAFHLDHIPPRHDLLLRPYPVLKEY